MNLRIALDIDSTLAGFEVSYNRHFKTNIANEKDHEITRRVYKLRHNKRFWLSLPKIEDINFIPEIYATKRINPKSYTREWIVANGFPDRPIYQTIYQYGNKADIIKGRCDVLIDDSFSNVKKCINSGVPAILINRPHNKGVSFEYRVSKLDIDEIESVYNQLLNDFPYLRKFTGS